MASHLFASALTGTYQQVAIVLLGPVGGTPPAGSYKQEDEINRMSGGRHLIDCV
jgi:hypothetical protein